MVRNILFLIVSSLLSIYFNKMCRIEDLLKSLYVLLLSIRSAFFSVICNLCLEIKLINLLCLILSRVQPVSCLAET